VPLEASGRPNKVPRFDQYTGERLGPPVPIFDAITGVRLVPEGLNLVTIAKREKERLDAIRRAERATATSGENNNFAQPTSFKPPYIRLTESILDMVINGTYFSLSSLCIRKEKLLKNKGSNASSFSKLGDIVIQNQDNATNIDQDHKNFGTWDDFVDGWLHYILLLCSLGYDTGIIQDRIITLRWLMSADYQPQSKLKFMFELRTNFPSNTIKWMELMNNNTMLMVQYLKPFDSNSPRHPRPLGDHNPRPNPRTPKVPKVNPRNPKTPKPKGGAITSTNKAAQVAALKVLQAGSATKLRLCYSSSQNKACTQSPCPFTHVCIRCQGAHPKVDCTQP
jgi:hypothetical protein